MKYRDKETGEVVEAEDGYVLGIKLITVTREDGAEAEAYLPDDFRDLFEPVEDTANN